MALQGSLENVRFPIPTLFKFEHFEGLTVIFEVETRLIKRFLFTQ